MMSEKKDSIKLVSRFAKFPRGHFLIDSLLICETVKSFVSESLRLLSQRPVIGGS